MLVPCAFNSDYGTDPGRRHGKAAEASAIKLAKRSMDEGCTGACAPALDSNNDDVAIKQMT
jgi:hypothetical protein